MTTEDFGQAPTRDWLRASIPLLFGGVFAVLVLVLAGGLWWHREEVLAQGQSRAENLALILGDHLTRTVSAIDATLVQLALHSQRMGGPQAAPETWDPVLAAALAGLPGVGSVTVTDDKGTITRSTIPMIVGQSRADLFIFRQLTADPNAGLVADTPFRSLLDGRLLIPLGRRLTAADGGFAGSVVATLEPERLRDFYRSVDVGNEGLVFVLHPAGYVLFREPSSADPMGESARTHPLLGRSNGERASGFLRARLEPDGPAYLSAFRRTRDPALVVAISLSEREVLAEWRREVLVSAGILLAVGLLLGLAGWWITREIAARAEAEAHSVVQAAARTAALDERDVATMALQSNQVRFQTIMDHAPMMVSLKDRAGRFTFVNRAYIEFMGRGADKILGRTVAELMPKEFSAAVARQDQAVVATRHALQWEVTVPHERGPRASLVVKFPVIDATGEVSAIGSILADISEQKRAEEQLAHAQRMEAVGQLTGGIAHDFNNLLTAILLNAEVLAAHVREERLRPVAEAVRMAAERGADLTRRLLAFGRRQVLEPRPTDVNELLANMQSLMQRTLGEHIEVSLRPAADLRSANVDPGQLENAVLNLAVNARDAMPEGGRLTLETANAELDEAYAVLNPEAKPGEYVMIAVGDTGRGMEAEVAARAFEPFFTTKDVGKGTGLGLSMVYGFVKQSEGHVRIYSELGIGTVVKLYLPRSGAAPVAAEIAAPISPELPTGDETVLFVEDDLLVRTHTERELAALGYRVVTAENAATALALVQDGCMPDLLFTDIVMPGMNGRELAERLRLRWPHLRVLYTSGYAHGALAHVHGEPVAGKYMLGKPYRRRDLAAKLREVLDEPAMAAS